MQGDIKLPGEVDYRFLVPRLRHLDLHLHRAPSRER
jgi:hypothetical protein